jgi:hypothetical protein
MTAGAAILSAELACIADGHPQVKEMLALSVGRIILKTAGGDVDKIIGLVEADKQPIKHVADWFKSAIIENAPWLTNLDEHGHSKKLMKYGSLERIFAEADKVTLRKSRGLGRRKLGEGAEQVVAVLAGGYSIVRMLTTEALDAESHEMQHCIGHGSYDGCLSEDSTTKLLSLRDKNGRAHATAEIRDERIAQVQGKQNKTPSHKYLSLLTQYFLGEKFEFGDFGNGSEGWVVDIQGNIHNHGNLPTFIQSPGNLYLNCGSVPSKIEARGAVIIDLADGAPPPLSIKAGGRVHLSGKGFRELPIIEMNDRLDLHDTMITSLSEKLSVKDLRVTNTPLLALPHDIKVGRNLVLQNTMVTSLPPSLWLHDGATVRAVGDVYIERSPVSSLGGLNTVDGSLSLNSTAMQELPERLDVSKGLHLSGNGGLDCKGVVKVGGDLSIAETDVRFRQKELIVGGSISIRNAKVCIPRRVLCGQTFFSSHTKLVMPNYLSCGSVDLRKTKINRYPKWIKATHTFLDVSPSGFWNGLSSLKKIETERLTVMDKPLNLGPEVQAETVVVIDSERSAVSMTTEQARDYLRKHKAFARSGGLKAYVETISGAIWHQKRIIYDEFHRVAA